MLTPYQEPEKPNVEESPCASGLTMDFKYDDAKGSLHDIYRKGQTAQWDADVQLDWSIQLDPDNPLSYDDVFLPVYGSSLWDRADSHEQVEIRRHYQAYTLSQFLHGEQAAMLAAGRLIQLLPTLLGKRFAAQQAVDEARHVAVFQRLLKEKVGIAYQMDAGVSEFFAKGLADPRWDFSVLTSQILIEGLALGLLQRMRDFSRNPLIQSLSMYVMADEARHVAFGLDGLGDYYAGLSDLELRERAEFSRDGLSTLQKRLNPAVVWRRLGLEDEVLKNAPAMQSFQKTVDRLSVRMEAMLEKLRLRPSSGGVDPGTRLKTWQAADMRMLEKMSRGS